LGKSNALPGVVDGVRVTLLANILKNGDVVLGMSHEGEARRHDEAKNDRPNAHSAAPFLII